MPATTSNVTTGTSSQFASLVESGHPAITFHSSSEPPAEDVRQLLAAVDHEDQTHIPVTQKQPNLYTSIPEPIRRILDSDMSSDAAPISASSFAAALTSLTLPTLHAKAAELRNQRAHLHSSNTQLQEFADAGDEDCQEAIRENGVVLQRMQERLELLRKEVVENRGMLWVEEEQAMSIDRSANSNGLVENSLSRAGEAQQAIHAEDMSGLDATSNGTGTHVGSRGGQGGTLGDEELARRLQERMDEDEADADGVHL